MMDYNTVDNLIEEAKEKLNSFKDTENFILKAVRVVGPSQWWANKLIEYRSLIKTQEEYIKRLEN